MKKLKITQKLVLYFSLMAIVTITVIGVVSYYMIRMLAIKNTKSTFEAIIHEKQDQLSHEFMHVSKELQYFADMLLSTKDTSTFTSQSKNLQLFLDNSNHYSGLLIESNQGNVYFSYGINSDKEYLHEIDCSDNTLFDFAKDLHLHLVLIRIIVNNNVDTAYVYAIINDIHINHILREGSLENNSSEQSGIAMFNADGKQLFNNRQSLSLFDICNNNFNTDSSISQDQIISVCNRITINQTEYYISISNDITELLSNSKRTSLIIELLLFSLLVIKLVIVVVVSRKITEPVIQLKKAIEQTGQGANVELLNIRTNDEFGQVSQAFNQMSNRIKRSELNIQLDKHRKMSFLIEGEEQERKRLSRELHDGLGQMLLATKMRIERIPVDEKNKEQIDAAKDIIVQAVEDTRRMSNNLMPQSLHELGLSNSIVFLCDELKANSDINIEVDIPKQIPINSENYKIYTFRIIQEAFNNILKHAEAQNVILQIRVDNSYVYITLSDDGIGYNPEDSKKPNSKGLQNIHDRIIILNGSLDIDTAPGKGCKISIKIPIHEKHS